MDITQYRVTEREKCDFNNARHGQGETDRKDAICTALTFIQDHMGLKGDDALGPTMLILYEMESNSEAAPGGLAAFVDDYLRDNNNAKYLLGLVRKVMPFLPTGNGSPFSHVRLEPESLPEQQVSVFRPSEEWARLGPASQPGSDGE